MSHKQYLKDFCFKYSRAQLEGRGGRLPLPFFENQKKCPDFGKKMF